MKNILVTSSTNASFTWEHPQLQNPAWGPLLLESLRRHFQLQQFTALLQS